MSVPEMAKEITIALINRMNIPGKSSDEYYPAKWAGEAYKIIFEAILHPERKS